MKIKPLETLARSGFSYTKMFLKPQLPTPMLWAGLELYIPGDRELCPCVTPLQLSPAPRHHQDAAIHPCVPSQHRAGAGGWQRPSRQPVRQLGTPAVPASGLTLSFICGSRRWKGRAAAQVVHGLGQNLQFLCPSWGQVRGLELWQVALGEVFQRRV